MTTRPMTAEPPLMLDLEPDTVPPLVAVRQWAARALSDLGEDHLVAVQLVATELLSNAYEHAGGAHQLRLRRLRERCRTVIEVDDSSDEQPTVVRERDPRVAGGRGLAMVDKLSSAWGSRPRSGGGKTVWGTIDCTVYPWDRCL
ncbi:ATP-binding protein [Amycolatopsis thermoflava]|uniref:ATP-binding protein n=1 Tax=Amycolatopsis thermoflava TaxID=84480 RepID=UPI0036538027